MVDRISDYHVPPFSPEADPEGVRPKKGRPGKVGEKLYNHSSSFYSWYKWRRKSEDPSQSAHNLQIIMQIAQKALLTPEKEEEAISLLSDLREDLNNGKISMDQIDYETQRIINDLTENNPQSRVVMYTTQIEMAINLSEGKPSGDLKKIFDQVIKEASTEMSNIQAETLNRNLILILNSDSSKDVFTAFQKTILPLLNKS